MSTHVKYFTRRNGDKIAVVVSVDVDTLVNRIADRMARQGTLSRKFIGGAIVADIVEK